MYIKKSLKTEKYDEIKTVFLFIKIFSDLFYFKINCLFFLFQRYFFILTKEFFLFICYFIIFINLPIFINLLSRNKFWIRKYVKKLLQLLNHECMK